MWFPTSATSTCIQSWPSIPELDSTAFIIIRLLAPIISSQFHIMCHLSPTVHLAWAILTCGLLVFLIQHLWRYDRFKCLSLSGGKQPGAFRRVMTYSYITSVPMLAVYTVSMTVLKYRNGYSLLDGHEIVPRPFYLWKGSDRAWLQPLYIIFGIVWGLEIVTHLEELMFWLFLLHQGPARRYWFNSWEFRIWVIGSCIAMAGLPLTAVLTRANPLKAEAYLFLVGSLSSFTITVLFFNVLAEFPRLLRTVKKEGAAAPVISRLIKFHELNILRVIFRLLMTVPLIILGADGVRPHNVINEHQLWTDLLAFLTAVGTVVSSAITLLIFFPRSLVEDSNGRPYSAETRSHYPSWASRVSRGALRRHQKVSLINMTGIDHTLSPIGRRSEMSELSEASPRQLGKTQIIVKDCSMPLQNLEDHNEMARISFNPPTTPSYPAKAFSEQCYSPRNSIDYESRWSISESDGKRSRSLDYEMSEESGCRLFSDIEIRLMELRLIELGQIISRGIQQPTRPPRLHPYITSFTSPIDLPYDDEFAPRAI